MELDLEKWVPMSPLKGPPLPSFMGIYWPWYFEEQPPEEQPPAAQPPSADIRLESLIIEPYQVTVGQTVNISMTATNYGDASGNKKIVLSVNDKTSEQTITLEPNESVLVNFEANPNVRGTYNVSVNGLTGSFMAIVPPYPIVFVGANISPISVLVSSGWWGTSYYAAAQLKIDWNAAHRVPEAEGGGSCNINVTWQLTKGAVTLSGSFSTTPQAREPAGAQYYYFPPGAGSVGWPYAGMQVSWGQTPPTPGTWDYTVNLKALVGGEVVGENTFSGTVQVS